MEKVKTKEEFRVKEELKTKLISSVRSLFTPNRRAFLSYIILNATNALFSIAVTPFYLHYLGAEGYGLIGFYNSVLSFSYFLDLGTSATVNREMARLSALNKSEQMRDTLRSLELLLVITSAITFILLIGVSFFLAYKWVSPVNLTRSEIFDCMILMNLAFCFQLLQGFYASSLMGLEKHVLLNSLMLIFLIVRYVGSLIVVVLSSSSKLYYFLLWQSLVYAAQSLCSLTLSWKIIGGFLKAKFQTTIVKSLMRFSFGILIAASLSLLSMNIDKFLLSRIFDLEEFGYYSFSMNAVILVFTVISAPFYQMSYPLLSKSISFSEKTHLKALYHSLCQKTSMLSVPIGLCIAFFSKDILSFWLRNEVFVENTSKLISILMICWTILSFKIVPHRLRLASGWTRLDIWENFSALVFLAVAITAGAYNLGLLGAALALLASALLSCYIVVYVTHKRILVGEFWNWFFLDTGVFIILNGIIFAITKFALHFIENSLLRLVTITISLAISISFSFLMTRLYKNKIEN